MAKTMHSISFILCLSLYSVFPQMRGYLVKPYPLTPMHSKTVATMMTSKLKNKQTMETEGKTEAEISPGLTPRIQRMFRPVLGLSFYG